MDLHVLVGDDTWALTQRRNSIVASASGRAPVSVDLDDGGRKLVEAACSPSLFGKQVFLASPASDIAHDNWPHLLAGTSPHTVIVTAPTLPLSIRRLVPADSMSEYLLPGRVDVAVRSQADALGVHLSPDVRKLLAAYRKVDVPRVRSALQLLAELGMNAPTGEQMKLLAGSLPPETAPWELSDPISRGDTADALESAATLDAIPTIAYLAGQASKDPATAESTWRLLAAADTAVKLSPTPRYVFDALVAELSMLHR